MRTRLLRLVIASLVVYLCGLPLPKLTAQENVSAPVIVVLRVQGGIEYEHEGWINHQPLLPGTIMSTADLIYPHQTTLLVMCPDGSTREFLPSELVPNAVLKCPVKSSAYVIGDSSKKRLNVRRGGRQNPAVPYVIGPRATAIRTAQVEVRWNPVRSAQSYTIAVRGGEQTWESGELKPGDVVQKNIARLKLPITLQEKTPYTIQICILDQNLRRHCTTDPDWSTGDNLAFYYVPSPALNTSEQQLVDKLGKETPESLYARAVLLSQPSYALSQTESIGYYDEAIALLEQIKTNDARSSLATSPGLYNLLGELYRDTNLPLSAAPNFKRASELAQPGTEIAARAVTGLAMTTPDDDAAVVFYNEALDHYAKFLNQDSFAKQLAAFCQQVGDLRFDIARCN